MEKSVHFVNCGLVYFRFLTIWSVSRCIFPCLHVFKQFSINLLSVECELHLFWFSITLLGHLLLKFVQLFQTRRRKTKIDCELFAHIWPCLYQQHVIASYSYWFNALFPFWWLVRVIGFGFMAFNENHHIIRFVLTLN